MPYSDLKKIFYSKHFANSVYFIISVVVIVYLFSMIFQFTMVNNQRTLFLNGGTIVCFEKNSGAAINLNSNNALLTQTHNVIIEKPNIKHDLAKCYGIVSVEENNSNL